MEVTTLAANDIGGVSVLDLFWQAHIVVKLVMIGLMAASVWSWKIIGDKFFLIRKSQKASKEFEKAFWSGQNLDDLYRNIGHRPDNPMAAIFVSAMREWKRAQDATGAGGAVNNNISLQMRIEKVMDVAIQREVGSLERNLMFLATTGSAAPFVGLFGTVFGIMNTFSAIAASKSTSLAVVAPGIAEALFATAIGLVAAIPAVIFYNKFSGDIGRMGQSLENFADEFSAIFSRQFENKQGGS
ncbi:MAG: protein TolQ [OCS116 cluster bacterium]|uniref:Tol-Pal system protein TolQ n=1 Tax=OCS116 cluster bacterium TaxID=2030921 RepID=A0A2A4Z5B5_9PROT|nr:protein TolQ [OCS116 cluster bacterium]